MIECQPTLLQIRAMEHPGEKVYARTDVYHWFAIYHPPFLPDDFVSLRYDTENRIFYTRRPELLEILKEYFQTELMELLL